MFVLWFICTLNVEAPQYFVRYYTHVGREIIISLWLIRGNPWELNGLSLL